MTTTASHSADHLGDSCGLCGMDGRCTDSRDVDGEEVVMCRDCAMNHDDLEFSE